MNPFTIRGPESKCPDCGAVLDLHEPVVTNGIPTKETMVKRGVSACIQCGVILRFNTDLTVRKATPEEIVAIMASNTGHIVERTQTIIRQLRHKRN